MWQVLFEEAISSPLQPCELVIIIASCSRQGSCNSGKLKNCPRTPEPEAAELQQPNSEAWPPHTAWQIHACILLPEYRLSFFQKPLLPLPKDLKWASQVVPVAKNLPANAGDRGDVVRSLGREDPLEEGVATHSSILAWRIPWTEELGRLQSMGLHMVRHVQLSPHGHAKI